MVMAIALILMISGCGLGTHPSVTGSLVGKLTTITGSPKGKQFVLFVGVWTNRSNHSVTFTSTTPATLESSGQIVYPWQYQSEMRSEFKQQCVLKNGKKVCTQPKATTVSVPAASSVRWSTPFAVPRGMCHASASIRIKGLAGVFHTKIPCR